MAAISGQLMYAVMSASTYPRVIERISAGAPVFSSCEPFSLAHSGLPVDSAVELPGQLSALPPSPPQG